MGASGIRTIAVDYKKEGELTPSKGKMAAPEKPAKLPGGGQCGPVATWSDSGQVDAEGRPFVTPAHGLNNDAIHTVVCRLQGKVSDLLEPVGPRVKVVGAKAGEEGEISTKDGRFKIKVDIGPQGPGARTLAVSVQELSVGDYQPEPGDARHAGRSHPDTAVADAVRAAVDAVYADLLAQSGAVFSAVGNEKGAVHFSFVTNF